jgi:hypothetical protein
VTDVDPYEGLRRAITRQQPLGPLDAGQFTWSKELLRLLYDPSNRIHRQASTSGAPYVIGRKGSGKTAFVMAPKLRPDAVTIELPRADLYQGVYGVVSMLLERRIHIFTEHAARLWRHMIWCVVLVSVAEENVHRDDDESRIVCDFARGIGGGAMPASPEATVSAYLRRLTTKVAGLDHVGGLGDVLGSVSSNGWLIEDAIQAACTLLKSSSKRYFVIVDSLEEYRGEPPTPDGLEAERISFQGLFRFVGGDGTHPTRNFDIRFAFPAELWPVFHEMSTNPSKDFNGSVIAHWSARELVVLLGNRIATYCELYEEGIADELGLTGPANAPIPYDECRRIISRVLPTRVTNAFRQREETLAYLLRHTQLLPRHLIKMLNGIWRLEHASDTKVPLPLSPSAVVKGVRAGARGVVDDVLASYLRIHPHARWCCQRVLPDVGLVIPDGELHTVYNRRGVHRTTGMEYHEFRRMLIEIGCLGRVIDDGTSRYVIGEFEYTLPGPLHEGSGERFCLHPVFADAYSSRHSASRLQQLPSKERSTLRAVYPVGSNPNEAADYRDAFF